MEEVFGLALAGVRGGPGELGLAVELHRVKEELEQTKDQLRQTQDDLKRRGENLVESASKLKVCEAELQGAREERDRARNDIEHSQLSKDEVLAKALQVNIAFRLSWLIQSIFRVHKNNKTMPCISDERPSGGEEEQGRSRACPNANRHAPDKQPTDGGHPAEDRAERAARAMANGHANSAGRARAQQAGPCATCFPGQHRSSGWRCRAGAQETHHRQLQKTFWNFLILQVLREIHWTTVTKCAIFPYPS